MIQLACALGRDSRATSDSEGGLDGDAGEVLRRASIVASSLSFNMIILACAVSELPHRRNVEHLDHRRTNLHFICC